MSKFRIEDYPSFEVTTTRNGFLVRKTSDIASEGRFRPLGDSWVFTNSEDLMGFLDDPEAYE